MNRLIFAIVLTALAGTTAAAAGSGHQASVHFEVGAPAGEFDENVDNQGYGLSLDYAYDGGGPLAIGLGGGYLIYGHESHLVSLPLVEDIEYVTDNQIASMHLLVRLQAGHSRMVPYLEGRFGGSYIWTDTKLTDQDWYDDDVIGRQTNYDDFALNWGGGGGLSIMLKQGDPDRGNDPDILLDMRVIYMNGGRADYLTEGAISVDVSDRVRIRPSESETDLVHFELGVGVRFKGDRWTGNSRLWADAVGH